jgi:hypothetical protein
MRFTRVNGIESPAVSARSNPAVDDTTQRPNSEVIEAASIGFSERFCLCGGAFLGATLDSAALGEGFTTAALEGVEEAFDVADLGVAALDDAAFAFEELLAPEAADCFPFFFSEVLGVSGAASSGSSINCSAALDAEWPSLDSRAFLNTNLMVAARASTDELALGGWSCMSIKV